MNRGESKVFLSNEQNRRKKLMLSMKKCSLFKQ